MLLDVILLLIVLLLLSDLLSQHLALSFLGSQLFILACLSLLRLSSVAILVLLLSLQSVAVPHHQLHRSGGSVGHPVGERLLRQHDWNHLLAFLVFDHEISGLPEVSLLLRDFICTLAVWIWLWIA